MIASNRPQHRPISRRRACLALAGAITIAGCTRDERALVGYDIQPAPHVENFTLHDATSDGAPFALKAQPNGVLLVYLGFTNCPDACPTAMTEIRAALERMGDHASAVDAAMITVDPRRDTPQVLTDYVRQFVDTGRALRTDDPDELRAIVDAFGASYANNPGNDGAPPDVGHTDYTYAVDDTGAVVITWTAEMTTDDIVNDVDMLLDRASADT
jgi:protein SCO1/2